MRCKIIDKTLNKKLSTDIANLIDFDLGELIATSQIFDERLLFIIKSHANRLGYRQDIDYKIVEID